MEQRATTVTTPPDAAAPVRSEGGMDDAIARHDWSTTPLGPMAGWPQSLRTVVRLMLDSRYAMWLAWGPELTFFCNDAYRPTLGAKRDFIGAPARSVWSEIWSDIGPRIASVLNTARATYDEGLLLYLERSGFAEETYHTFSYSPVQGDGGAVEGMLCVVTEATERVLAERRLSALADLAGTAMAAHDSQQACQAALQVLAQVECDVPFAVIYFTDAGGRRARLVGSSSTATMAPPAEVPLDGSHAWQLEAIAAGGEPWLTQTLDGIVPARCRPWPEPVRQAIVLPLARHGQEGRQAGFLIAGVSPRLPLDAAYRRFFALVATHVENAIADAQAFEGERQRAEQLAALDRAKTTFFSNISHELRTPLTLIASPVEQLLASEPDPGRRTLLELTQRNAQRLQRLVNTLLEFARIEAGRVRASPQPVHLGELTRHLASVFRSAIEQAGLRYDVDCDDLPGTVMVDPEMWEQILLNLVSNAFKFTLQGGIAVRLRAGDGQITLEVADTGVGVPEHEIPRLFERFHRVEGAAGRTQEGSGIGLALVQELVRIHGGSVDVESRHGSGTTFRVHLPLSGMRAEAGTSAPPAEAADAPAAPTMSAGAPAAPGAMAFVQEALSWGAADPVAAPSADAGLSAMQRDRRFADTFGARIVLADDNGDMRSYVSRLLGATYSVEAVADGLQALAAARRQRPDIVVSDVMMPGLDGFGLLRALRSEPALADVPLILVSARAGEEARIESLDAGADDYLVKPFSARELVARVGALLERAQQRQGREALLESLRLRTAQFESLLDKAPVGVYLVDADLRIVEANPTARPVFGAIDNLIGRDFDEVIHTLWPRHYADELVAKFRHTLATGEPHEMAEHIEQRLDRGVTEYYEWRIHRIPLPDGRPGVVCYFRDISAHVKARLRLEASDRQKDVFLAMLAHELRNPLAPIRSAGDLLARVANATPQARAATQILRRQVELLSRLVDDLLDVSRITQQRIELERTPLKLADIVSQAVETVAPLLQERRHRIALASDGVLGVHGDRARLVQCVVNLLTNAAKYTEPGGSIRVDSRAEGNEAVLRVIDNGAGISPDLLPHVFDLFVQSDRTLDRSQGGLGIGLSLVKRLVEMHGGRVSARSDGPGLGTTVEIRLPAAPPASDERQAALSPALSPMRILVVDDNADAAQSLGLVLRLDGHDVDVVQSSTAALAHIRERRPAVVLLDIGLPLMDGYEVARQVRSSAELAAVKLVALTGYGQAEDRHRALASGFDDHLVKPVEYTKLLSSLGRVLAPPPGAAT